MRTDLPDLGIAMMEELNELRGSVSELEMFGNGQERVPLQAL